MPPGTPEGDDRPLDAILRQADSFPTAQDCVLTGGEPMVAKGIHDLAFPLKARGKHITIETAATVPPSGLVCNLASLSPKLSNSTPDQRLSETWFQKHNQLRNQTEVIRQWIDHYPYQLKFVTATPSNLYEIHLLLSRIARTIPPMKVLMMPEGTLSDTTRARTEILLQICKRYGYRYCNRLHVDLFGHTRGT